MKMVLSYEEVCRAVADYAVDRGLGVGRGGNLDVRVSFEMPVQDFPAGKFTASVELKESK